MPDRVIKCVNAIGAKEKQGQAFWFLNRCKGPFEWTDEVPEDNPEFQELLEDKVAGQWRANHRAGNGHASARDQRR